MTREQIEDKIAHIVKNSLPGFADVELKPETRINTDANVDSMSFVYIMCQIEAAFDVRIPDRLWGKMKTFSDVVDAVEKAWQKKRA